MKEKSDDQSHFSGLNIQIRSNTNEKTNYERYGDFDYGSGKR